MPEALRNEFEEDDDTESYESLLKQEVKGDCRCGKCCSLLIEVDVEDARRESRIAEEGSPIYSDPRETVSGQRELIGYLLNAEKNGYACAFLDRTTNLCAIYETRPLICRLYNCEGEGREQLIDLGMIER